MRVPDHLVEAEKDKRFLISFEIIPPKRVSGSIEEIISSVEDLAVYKPPFIDVTTHPAEEEMRLLEAADETKLRRLVRRERPGTGVICTVIRHKYGIDAVPHVLCIGFTREETEDFLIDMNYAQIDNVLALTGDENGYEKKLQPGKTRNRFSIELLKQIVEMNNGKYLHDDGRPAKFCTGVATYCEGHYKSPNIETDIAVLLGKEKAGASYAVTQMHFSSADYLSFVERARKAGVTIPIIPGLKIITSRIQVTGGWKDSKYIPSIPEKFHVKIPHELTERILAADPKDVSRIGVEHAAQQVEELRESGLPIVHFYTMLNTRPIKMLAERLGYWK